MRTTSSLESMNSAIQRKLSKRTNIFRFSKDLRMHEAIKSSDLYQLFEGDISNRQLERKRAADRERDEKIKHFSALLENGYISVPYFLEVMSGKDVLPPVGSYDFSFLYCKKYKNLNCSVYSLREAQTKKYFESNQEKQQTKRRTLGCPSSRPSVRPYARPAARSYYEIIFRQISL